MPTERNRRCVEILAALERQNNEWERAWRALAQLGDAPVAVRHEFLRQIDHLARPEAPQHLGLRG